MRGVGGGGKKVNGLEIENKIEIIKLGIREKNKEKHLELFSSIFYNISDIKSCIPRKIRL